MYWWIIIDTFGLFLIRFTLKEINFIDILLILRNCAIRTCFRTAMSYDINYQLVRPAGSNAGSQQTEHLMDRMTCVSTLNRIANVACEKIMLLMNNTRLLKHPRLSTMDEVLMYLHGEHDDLGLPGDRGDLWRRKLAEQVYLHYAVHGVDHTNVIQIVDAAILLRKTTSRILAENPNRQEAPPYVDISDTMLDILGRIADMH